MLFLCPPSWARAKPLRSMSCTEEPQVVPFPVDKCSFSSQTLAFFFFYLTDVGQISLTRSSKEGGQWLLNLEQQRGGGRGSSQQVDRIVCAIGGSLNCFGSWQAPVSCWLQASTVLGVPPLPLQLILITMRAACATLHRHRGSSSAKTQGCKETFQTVEQPVWIGYVLQTKKPGIFLFPLSTRSPIALLPSGAAQPHACRQDPFSPCPAFVIRKALVNPPDLSLLWPGSLMPSLGPCL